MASPRTRSNQTVQGSATGSGAGEGGNRKGTSNAGRAAFTRGSEILKRHDYTEATESSLDISMLHKVVQVKDFGKRSRTKYTQLLDRDTTRVGTDGKGGGATCFICGGPLLKKDCPSNQANGGKGGPDAATGSNSVAGPPTKKFGIGSRQAEEESSRNDRGGGGSWRDRDNRGPPPRRDDRRDYRDFRGEATAMIDVVMIETGGTIGREGQGTTIVLQGAGRGRIHHRAKDMIGMMGGDGGQGQG